MSRRSGKILSAMGCGKIMRGIPRVYQWGLIEETREHFDLTLRMPEKPNQTLIHRIRRHCPAYVEAPVRFDIRLGDDMDEGLAFRYVASRVK
ncbi:MAG: hypothetical protein P8182_02180, partial [Deltaproteobacteria bacterium]